MSAPAQPPIDDYAAIGDGRTAALISRAGSIDWLCLPDFDGTPVLARLLDLERGGAAALAPAEPYDVARRYLPDSNVLESVYTTAAGVLAVTDGMGEPGSPTLLARRIELRSGRMRVSWSVRPRFGDGIDLPTATVPSGPGATFRGPAAPDAPGPREVAVTVAAWGLGGVRTDPGGMEAEAELGAGDRGVLVLAAGEAAPERDAVERSLDAGLAAWERYGRALEYDGPWPDAVRRSTLVLKLLAHAPTGGIVGAPTSSLPELPGGRRNFDYRYCWLRDASFVVDGLSHAGDRDTVDHFLRWLERATGSTAPRLQPFYRLSGGTEAPQRQLELAGYRGARPVLAGNGASSQRQLGTYGDLMQSCALFVGHGSTLPPGLGDRLASAADHVVAEWRKDDAGIWEITPYRAHTWSKMSCWVALDRAGDLSDGGHVPAAGRERWAATAERIRAHVEAEHWSEERVSYVAAAGSQDLDAAVLLGVFTDYPAGDAARWHATLERLDEELGHGSLLYRTTHLRDREETFLPCAFWRVHALARLGRVEEAAAHMEALLRLGGELGLFSEEAARDGRLWGNKPQALTHGALINAAVAVDKAGA